MNFIFSECSSLEYIDFHLYNESENLNGIDLEKLNKSSDSDLSENSNPNYYIDGEIIENRTVWDDGTPVDGEVYLVKKSDGRLVCYENGVEYPESYFY